MTLGKGLLAALIAAPSPNLSSVLLRVTAKGWMVRVIGVAEAGEVPSISQSCSLWGRVSMETISLILSWEAGVADFKHHRRSTFRPLCPRVTVCVRVSAAELSPADG